MGVRPQSFGEVLNSVHLEGCSVGELGAVLRIIEREQMWDLVFLHPQNWLTPMQR